MKNSPPSTAIEPGMIASNCTPTWAQIGPGGRTTPNVLQIILDDTGWSDFGCFGSPINTPNFDGLASQGLRYTNFHVTPLCSPTRAALMTGRNHHSVGMRFLTALDTGFDNSRGRVDPDTPMIPALLRDRGYGSYLVGKWHLAPKNHITPSGPFHHWPIARGFDRFFGFLDGCTDQYFPELYRDNSVCPNTFEDGEHLNDVLADQAIEMLADHAAFRDTDPFFMTFALGATHAPLQAPKELIDKYVPIFERGWDEEREQRLKRQHRLGVVPEGTQLTERNPGVSPWAELDEKAKRLFTRQMAAYAAFLEHADAAVGRVLEALGKFGMRDDTLVLVLADNGASREGGEHGAVDIHANYSGRPEPVDEQIKRFDAIGTAEGPAHYPEGWAMASNTPFRRYKQLVDLGGVRAPLIANWPKGITDHGAVRTGFAHAIDLAATIAELCNIPADGMHGQSIAESFTSDSHPTRSHQYWEMFGHRAVWKNGWKAVTEHETGKDYNADIWRLYDTNSDFSESRDIADAHPETLEELKTLWMEEAKAFGVFPLDDRPMKQLLNQTRSPYALTARQRVTFYPEGGHIPVATGIAHASRPMRVLASFDTPPAGQKGCIITTGAGHCGYALSLDGTTLVFEHAALGTPCRIEATIGSKDNVLGFEVIADWDGHRVALVGDQSGLLTKAFVPNSVRNLSFWGMDVGRPGAKLNGTAPARSMALPSGSLHSVTFEFDDDGETLAQAEDHAKTD